uniref:Uncharacterized protein n=1 Tax=Acrobeloides nanus TaxID=290746 RepID=A0A914E328_9BILA
MRDSGYDQVSAVVNRLNAAIDSVSNMFIWVNIDISQPWSKNQNENRVFMNEVVLALFRFNGGFGVISNNNSWSTIFGADYNVTDIAEFLIWVKWNGKQDLTTDWVPFGGWSSPFVHQYAGGITSNNCVPGIKLNYNYFTDANSGPLMNAKVQKSINKRRLHRFNRKQ